MYKYIYIIVILMGFGAFAQTDAELNENKEDNRIRVDPSKKKQKPSVTLYKMYSLEKDTTYVDTTLSVRKEYKFNYLRKDIFGLMPFSNEGHTYTTLYYGIKSQKAFPEFGFQGKHFAYLNASDVLYYSVPTPLTDLYFKTVMGQGQNLDAFLTLNTSRNLNFSIAYKGLRSLGKYIHNLSSNGNFRFTTSYVGFDNKYILNAHVALQDFFNEENGGILYRESFELSEPPYDQRERLDVYFEDASSALIGKRVFLDQTFKLSPKKNNSLLLMHQFAYEYKTFEFIQTAAHERFGEASTLSIRNKTRYTSWYNRVGAGYTFKQLGDIKFYLQQSNYNYGYSQELVPVSMENRMLTYLAQYDYQRNKWKGKIALSNALTEQGLSSTEVQLSYFWKPKYTLNFQFEKMNKLPDWNTQLYQSDYLNYNWNNSFKNEKTNKLVAQIQTPFLTLTGEYTLIDDKLYFANTHNTIDILLVKPFQHNSTLTYTALKAQNEIHYGKFALDNTLLYQSVSQSEAIINVPQWVTRNTLYYSEHLFKRAMFLQTGITFQYFTQYYANDYNPVIGDFYNQTQYKIGNYPTLDFFVNAKVRQTRIYFKAEHFNSSFTGYNYYAAPNYPYHDFMIRFGLVWNFFQ